MMKENLRKYDNAVAEYLTELRYTGASEKTLDNYTKRLKYFRDFWEAENPVGEPDSATVKAWRNAMLEKGLSPKTVKQYMVELKAFFEYCADEENDDPIYDRNPVSKRMFPKTKAEERKPYEKILGADDLIKLFSNDYKGDSKLHIRNYAIVTLLLDSKIRNAELLDMKLKDVDFEHGEVTVRRGKGNKFRIVTLTDISVAALKLYLKAGIRPDYCTADDYLFGTTAENKFGGNKTGCEWHRGSSQWLSKTVEKYVKDATGKEGFRSHSMRHNGAALELNNGTSLERIQAELGHSSVATTEIYAGKVLPVRHAKEAEEVIKARDFWARKNNERLAAMA